MDEIDARLVRQELEEERRKQKRRVMMFFSREMRLLIVALGLIGTMMPWFAQVTPEGVATITLLAALGMGNVGVEVAGLLFYLGLAACILKDVEWSLLGGILMVVGVIAFLLSDPGFSLGGGFFIGIATMALTWAVVVDWLNVD